MPWVSLENGIKLYYETHGSESGLPLVLIHGFPLSLRQWDSVVPLLLKQAKSMNLDLRLILPDMRGHGQSESTDTATMADYADDLAALLQEVVGPSTPAVMLGMSFGGYVLFEYWRRFADRVRALVLADTRAIPDFTWHAKKRHAAAESILEERSAVSVSFGVASLCAKGVDPEIVRTGAEIIAASPYVGVAAGMRAVADRPDSRGTLPTINVPTLILCGEEDSLTPVDMHVEMNEGIKASQMVVVPKAGHMMCMEKPREFAELVVRFVSTL